MSRPFPSSDLERVALNRHFEEVTLRDPTVNRGPSFTKGPRRAPPPAACSDCKARTLPSGERAVNWRMEGGKARIECSACGRATLGGKPVAP